MKADKIELAKKWCLVVITISSFCLFLFGGRSFNISGNPLYLLMCLPIVLSLGFLMYYTGAISKEA